MRSRRTNRGALVVALVLVAAACALLAGTMSAGGHQDDDVQDARAALEKWIETRRIISRERRDWMLGREMLADRIGLVEREIASHRERIADAEKSIVEADRKRAELSERNEKLKEASAGLQAIVIRLEERTRNLLRRLPDPIRERVRPLSQRMPEKTEQTRLTLSERFQNIVGIVNEVNKFNREITVKSEVRTLADGSRAEVTALYVGIGQAYYVTARGEAAGIGVVTAKGWTWKPAHEAAPEIRKAIAILKNERAAEFVALPVEIK